MSVFDINKNLSDCSVVNDHCSARCICDDGYAGHSCSLTSEQHLKQLSLRYMLADGLRNLSALENVEPDTIRSWVVGLATLASHSASLSESTKVLMAISGVDVLTKARILGSAVEELDGISTVIDFALSSAAAAGAGREGAGTDAGSGGAFTVLLNLYSEFIMDDMVEGQNSVSVIAELFRLSSFAVHVSSSSSTVLSSAVSDLDQLFDQPGHMVFFPPAAIASEEVMQVTMKTVMPSGSGSFNASYLSLPLGLTFMKPPCDSYTSSTSPIPCTVVIVLQNLEYDDIDDSDVVGNESLITYDAVCEYGLAKDYSFECPNSFGSGSSFLTSSMIISCNGSVSGPITQTCSSYKHVAACESIGKGGSGRSCELIAASSYNVSCNCTLHPPSHPAAHYQHQQPLPLPHITNTAHRPITNYAKTNAKPRTAIGALTNGRDHPFLQTDDGSDDESTDDNYESEGVSVSFVAVQISIASDFASTFRSAGDLSASEVAGSWDVLVTVLVLGGFFTLTFILAD
jgi:hypothetical protein